MRPDPFSKALNYAYRLLSVRERSEEEIKRRLKEKGHGLEYIKEVIGRLKTEGLLNDARFVQAWIKDRSTYRLKGPLAIRDELLKKGIKRSLVEAALKDEEIGYDEYEVARALVVKKFGPLPSEANLPLTGEKIDRIKRKKSIYNYLARRGFSFDIINDIVDKI